MPALDHPFAGVDVDAQEAEDGQRYLIILHIGWCFCFLLHIMIFKSVTLCFSSLSCGIEQKVESCWGNTGQQAQAKVVV